MKIEISDDQAALLATSYSDGHQYNMPGNQAIQAVCHQVRVQLEAARPIQVGDIVHLASSDLGYSAKMYVIAVADAEDGTQAWCRDADNELSTYNVAALTRGVRP